MYQYRVQIIMPQDFDPNKVKETLRQIGFSDFSGSTFRVDAISGLSEQVFGHQTILQRGTLTVAIGDPGELCITVRSAFKTRPIFEVLGYLGISSDQLAVRILEAEQEGMDG